MPPGTAWRVRRRAKNPALLLCESFFPPGWEARLYGKQGCLPLPRGVRHPCLTWRAATLPPGNRRGYFKITRVTPGGSVLCEMLSAGLGRLRA